MSIQLRKHWDRLRSSFWFLPSLMAAAAAALAFATVVVDGAVTDPWLQARGWAYTGGPEGASLLLGTIAGSMITIAGVVFSLTLVALSLTSSQFGPRLLRNFMSDTSTQLVLGTFVATFLYCLLVLRTIRHGGDAFVPHLSISVGVLFALVSVGVLIYFIHHISVSIQADEIVARVDAELMAGIERLFPQHLGRGAAPPAAGADLPESFGREARSICADADGYLQRIDADTLMSLAEQEDVVLRLERRPGHYVVMGSALAMVWPAQRVSDEFAAKLLCAFVLGTQRTPAQDVEYAVNQLVEIAVRALSPGVNDPFTAIVCVDRLGSALCRLTQREMPSPFRFDRQGRLRVVAPAVSFPPIADAAFNQIRQYAQTSAAVSIRLLDTITVIATAASRAEDRAALLLHAQMIARGAVKALPEDEDRRAVEARFDAARQALGEPGEARR